MPDFVAEAAGAQLLIEVKATDQLEDASVLRKRAAARMVPRGERPRFGARAEALYTSDDPA
ncbi:MAG: hypothetical protein INR68_07075 [Methylobacterium mesophilicum]|nr:hypothetical protein [Methylobacterium mesophilicum]